MSLSRRSSKPPARNGCDRCDRPDMSCSVCGEEFEKNPGPGRPRMTCSLECRRVSRKALHASYPRTSDARIPVSFQVRVRSCQTCGVEWSNLPGRGNGALKFCSAVCGVAFRKGYKNPKERSECVAGCGRFVVGTAFQLLPRGGSQSLCDDCVSLSSRRGVRLSVRKRVWRRDNNRCWLCGLGTDMNDRSWGTTGPKYPTVDHLVPRSLGGSDDVTNLRTAHALCNARRGSARGEQLAWAVG